MKEFKSEHKDAHYRDESKSFEDKDKIVEDLDQN